MTFEIALTLAILLLAIVLFVTEIIRADLVALLVLVTLVVVGLVSPPDSISGFSNPAVVTIWAVFILSAGLARTGVASVLGSQILRLAGKGEGRLLAVLISGTAFLSAFMNNIGVAAMFLPVTLDIARRTGRRASALLMPMAYGSLIGGMLILIGTASNLVVSDFLREAGLRPLGLFDFTLIGLAILAVSLVYMLLLGHRLLPVREAPSVESITVSRENFHEHYGLEERLIVITIPEGSPLGGKTLAESRFGQALGLNILSIERGPGMRHVPEPGLSLEEGDRLLALGRLDVIDDLAGTPIVLHADPPGAACLVSEEIRMAEVTVGRDSIFNGRTLVEIDARQTLGVNLLAIRRDSLIRRTNLRDLVLEEGDRILLQGTSDRLESLRDERGFRYVKADESEDYNLDERLLCIEIPEGSSLAGLAIRDTRLASRYGISVLKVTRDSEDFLMPDPERELREGDLLVVGGRPVDIEVLRAHQDLSVDTSPSVDLRELESESLAIVEVMLSPYASFTGKTLRELDFREKYGISLLAIWRGDRSYRTGLVDIPLQFGDALLCYGSRDRFEVLGRDRDFVVLNMDYREKLLVEKAPLAGLIMLGVVLSVILGWLPIYVAAIAGASLMVLTGCLTLEEAYSSIEWKAVFLIAAMLPMGLAMQATGAASLIAGSVVDAVGPYGPTSILAGIMTLTLVINQFIPSAVNAVVMTPIALATAAGLGISPYPFVMGIAYAVAASFMTPVSHPANVLVMTPGGYRFSDYIVNGLPFSLIVLMVSVVLLPIVFPY